MNDDPSLGGEASETPAGTDNLDADWGTAGRALAQSDIDSLFGDAGKATPDQGDTRRGYEALIGGELVGLDRLPVLNIIVDRLTQLMTASMRSFTGDNADVSIDRIKPMRLKDFLDDVTLPAMIAVIRIEQWDGYCLAALDPRLIGLAVDVLLGGRRNRAQLIEGRPYTAIERVFVERLVNEVITRDLRQAFELICEVDFVLDRFEGTPSYAAITKLSAAAVGFRAEVSMEGRGGHIDFLIPYATLEPVRDLLSQEFVAKRHGDDPVWRSHLLDELPHTTVTLRAVVERRRISCAEVLRWRPGSKLFLNRRHDEPIDVLCNDLPVLRTRIAEKDGRIALHVEERRFTDDWPASG
jgi:flagellar motor switch protein FliM